MDKDEAILSLRKNKLEMEHQALLQDREVILIAETGVPITVANIVVAAQWYTHPAITMVLLVSSVIVAIVEWLRRKKNTEIANRRQEIERFIAELASGAKS